MYTNDTRPDWSALCAQLLEMLAKDNPETEIKPSNLQIKRIEVDMLLLWVGSGVDWSDLTMQAIATESDSLGDVNASFWREGIDNRPLALSELHHYKDLSRQLDKLFTDPNDGQLSL